MKLSDYSFADIDPTTYSGYCEELSSDDVVELEKLLVVLHDYLEECPEGEVRDYLKQQCAKMSQRYLGMSTASKYTWEGKPVRL